MKKPTGKVFKRCYRAAMASFPRGKRSWTAKQVGVFRKRVHACLKKALRKRRR